MHTSDGRGRLRLLPAASHTSTFARLACARAAPSLRLRAPFALESLAFTAFAAFPWHGRGQFHVTHNTLSNTFQMLTDKQKRKRKYTHYSALSLFSPNSQVGTNGAFLFSEGVFLRSPPVAEATQKARAVTKSRNMVGVARQR